MRTLSDKAWIKEDEEGVLITYGHEDVKQFIKDLKKNFDKDTDTYYDLPNGQVPTHWEQTKRLNKIIDKLAGDKLIKEQKQLNNRSAN